MWGVKGVLNYFRAKLENRRWHQYFEKNAAKYDGPKVEGLTIVGPLSSQGSTNKVLRDLCFSLKEVGIPFQTFDLGKGEIPKVDIEGILTPEDEFRIGKYSHLVEMLSSPVQDGLVGKRARIVFWEFESGLLEAYPTLAERRGDVIAMSDYNFHYYQRTIPRNRSVFKLLYPLRIDVGRVNAKDTCRERFGLAPNEFVVFYNFSFASGWNRKNAMGALEAFRLAFGTNDSARLVFKTAARKGHEDRYKEMMDYIVRHHLERHVKFVDDYLTQDELYDLTNACDVYLSMHRSEGFGLGIAEAMMMSKAVVITAYSSPLEFCNENNSCQVPYRMIPVECADVPWYAAAKEWADPDVKAAADFLRELFDNPDKRRRLGVRAKADIERIYSKEAFRASVMAYIKSSL